MYSVKHAFSLIISVYKNVISYIQSKRLNVKVACKKKKKRRQVHVIRTDPDIHV